MMRFCRAAIVFSIVGLFSATSQGEDEMDLVPLPVDAASLDITGAWEYSTFNHQVAGKCPAGTTMAGTLLVAHKDGAIELVVQSGAVCNPASMCSYSGEFKGGDVVVSNTDTVDDEGGSATNAMRLFFYSESKGGGEVSSRYVHPRGFECHWSHNMELRRPGDN